MTTTNIDDQLLAQATAAAPADRPVRRSFLTGKVLDPDLHPGLRTRIQRALRFR